MRILHTSDWHLGMMFGNISLKDDQKYFIDLMVDCIKKENIQAVIVAGDVYDSSVSNSEAIGLYNYAATKVCIEMNIPMIVIAGNHDGAARLAVCSELLKKAGLYVTGKLDVNKEPVSLGNVDIYCLPYFTSDEAKAQMPDCADTINSNDDAFAVICDNIRQRMDRSKTNIVVSHSFVVGASLSESDKAARVGSAMAISKNVFEEFDYVALGHIHRPQDVGNKVRYSGSPLVYSFGSEEKYTKSFTIYDTDKDSVSFYEITPLHQVTTIKGTYDEIMKMEDVTDYLKIMITDRFVGLETVCVLKEKFENVIEIQGKSFENEKQGKRIQMEEISKMSDEEIIVSFFREIFDYEPDEEQMKLIEDAKEYIEREEELS